MIKVYDSLSDPTPTLFADLRTRSTTTWDRGLLGLALPPNFPSNPYVYVCTPTTRRPAAAAPIWNDICPTARTPALHRQRPAVAAARQRQHVDRHRAGAHQRLVPAVPEPLDRRPALRPRRRALRQRRRRRQLSATDYGQFGSPVNPCGDPPGGVGTALSPPTAEGGALRSQDVRTPPTRPALNGTIIRIDPATGAARPATRSPARPPTPTRAGSSRTACATRSASPSGPAPARSGSATSAGTPGRRSTGCPTRRPRPSPTSAGRATRATRQQPGYRRRQPEPVRVALRTPASATAPYYTYNHTSQVVAGESCPTGGSVRHRRRVLPDSRRQLPGRRTSGALFFADYARDCIWAMLPASRRPARPDATSQTFARRRAPARSTWRSAPAATCTTSTSTAARSGGSATSPATSRRPPSISATPTSGAPPLAVQFNGAGSTDPDPADQGRLTYQWDFTNDGTLRRDRRRPRATRTPPPGPTRPSCGSPTRSALTDTKTRARSWPATTRRCAVIDTPGGRRSPGRSATRSASPATPPTPQEGTLPGVGAALAVAPAPLLRADNCHAAPHAAIDGVAGGSFIAPDHEYPSYLELRLTATDSSGLTTHRQPSAATRRPST